MLPPAPKTQSVYDRIYRLVERIPAGQVATYGQLARMAECTARQAGYAMAAAPPGLPWHRVINSRGEISLRRQGGGEIRQRRLLRAEGIRFDRRGRLDLPTYHWPGPGWAWLQRHGYAPETT